MWSVNRTLQQVQQAIALIEARLFDDVTLAKLAAEVHSSPFSARVLGRYGLAKLYEYCDERFDAATSSTSTASAGRGTNAASFVALGTSAIGRRTYFA